jgi:hypothetical protein
MDKLEQFMQHETGVEDLSVAAAAEDEITNQVIADYGRSSPEWRAFHESGGDGAIFQQVPQIGARAAAEELRPQVVQYCAS